jgi:RNA polymerase sigma-70 factor, ECF subfamily
MCTSQTFCLSLLSAIAAYLCEGSCLLDIPGWELPLVAALMPPRPLHRPLSDAELVEAYQQTHDLALIHQLVERYRPAIRSISYQFTTRTFTPADVQQELVLVLVKKLPGLTVRRSLKGWLCTTLRHWLIDQQRHEGSHDNYCRYQKVHGEAAEASCENHLDRQQWVDQALGLLRREEACCVQLHYLEGFSYQEIADELGWSFKKVTGHMYRALKRLRQQMDLQALADSLQA